MDEESTLATMALAMNEDGTCARHPHIKLRERTADGYVFQKDSCEECDREFLAEKSSLKEKRKELDRQLQELEEDEDNNNNNNNDAAGHEQFHSALKKYVSTDDIDNLRDTLSKYKTPADHSFPDDGGVVRSSNGGGGRMMGGIPAPAPSAAPPGAHYLPHHTAPPPAPTHHHLQNPHLQSHHVQSHHPMAGAPTATMGGGYPRMDNDAGYTRPSLTIESLASQMNRMQQMQDWLLQQKEAEMQLLRQKVEQQQKELLQKEVEIALLKEKLIQQEHRMQQELKLMELSMKGGSSKKSSSSSSGKKEIHIQELHVQVGNVDKNKNGEVDPKMVQEATAKATTAAIENAERQLAESSKKKVVTRKMVVKTSNNNGTTTAVHSTAKSPTPAKPTKKAPPTTALPAVTMAASTIPDPPHRYASMGDVGATLASHNDDDDDEEEDDMAANTDDLSDVKIPENVSENDDDDFDDIKDDYDLVGEEDTGPEPTPKREVLTKKDDNPQEFTFVPPTALQRKDDNNGKEELDDEEEEEEEEEDEEEGGDTFDPNSNLWDAASSKRKAQQQQFKQGPLTQAAAAAATPADLYAGRKDPMRASEASLQPLSRTPNNNNNNNMNNNNNNNNMMNTPPESAAAMATTIRDEPSLADLRFNSVPRDLKFDDEAPPIVPNNEDVTIATFGENSFLKNNYHDGDDGKSLGNTVASSTYGEDRQKVVAQTLLDPYGDKGKYTGIVLRSTGMPHGLGRMVYEDDGRTYEGDWRHGRWHGFGRATFANGDSYEGEYRFDQRHGRGMYCWNDGRVYDGNFAEDKRHGKGTFKWPDGATYEGDFVQGQREGHGRYTFSDGGYYNGSWVDGRYEGYGECHWEDGRTYKGEWKTGMAHGQGVETYPDGRVRHDGQWINDEPIRPN